MINICSFYSSSFSNSSFLSLYLPLYLNSGIIRQMFFCTKPNIFTLHGFSLERLSLTKPPATLKTLSEQEDVGGTLKSFLTRIAKAGNLRAPFPPQ